MTQEDLFGAALGLQSPWKIEAVELKLSDDNSTKELHIYINFERGCRFKCEGELRPVYDHNKRTWQHLNFFQHHCYLHAQVPRVKNSSGNTLMVEVPWARPGSSFTLLFEAFAMCLVGSSMSLTEAGKTIGVDSRVVGRIIRQYVDNALYNEPLDTATSITIDETAIRRGHNYITVITDIDRKKVIGIGQGKDYNAVREATEQMEARGSFADQVTAVAVDLSPAYTSAVLDQFPNAEIVYDRFHVEQMLSRAVNEVRKLETDEQRLLKKSKFLWLRNEARLTQNQKEKVHYLQIAFPTLGLAYRLKELFKEVYNTTEPDDALEAMEEWLKMASESGIIPIVKFCSSIKSHWTGIVTFFKKRITSAFAERINLKIQEVKRTARGYRNIGNYIAMIYFHLGKLNKPTHN
jgi:transposase